MIAAGARYLTSDNVIPESGLPSIFLRWSVDHYRDAAFRSENAGQVEEEANEEAKEKEAKDEVIFVYAFSL